MKAPDTHGIPAVLREERKHVRRGQCAGAAGGEGGCVAGGSVGFFGASEAGANTEHDHRNKRRIQTMGD